MSTIDIDKSKKILLEIFEITKPDEGHGLEHALTVYQHSVEALKYSKENLSLDIIINVQLASLLHDVEDHKFVRKEDKGKWIKYFFDNYFDNYRQQDMDLVIEIIDSVSCSKHGDNRTRPENWFYITRYSDRLEATGETGIKRAIIYSNHISRPFFNENTIRIYDKEEIDNKISISRYQEYKRKSNIGESTIDHLYDKVIHLNIPEWMDNEYLIKEMNIRRSYVREWIVNFWKQL